MLIEIEAGKKDVEEDMAEIATNEEAVEDGLAGFGGREARRKQLEGSHEARAVQEP